MMCGGRGAGEEGGGEGVEESVTGGRRGWGPGRVREGEVGSVANLCVFAKSCSPKSFLETKNRRQQRQVFLFNFERIHRNSVGIEGDYSLLVAPVPQFLQRHLGVLRIVGFHPGYVRRRLVVRLRGRRRGVAWGVKGVLSV